jgi:hypothetical protein
MFVGRCFYNIDPEKVFKKYGAVTYLGYWQLPKKNSGYNDSPVDVFYQPNPDTKKGHTNYFGLYENNGVLYICNASPAFKEPITVLVHPKTGEVIASHYPHDFRSFQDHSLSIDGGRSYTRIVGNFSNYDGGKPVTVEMKVRNGCFYIGRKKVRLACPNTYPTVPLQHDTERTHDAS